MTADERIERTKIIAIKLGKLFKENQRGGLMGLEFWATLKELFDLYGAEYGQFS